VGRHIVFVLSLSVTQLNFLVICTTTYGVLTTYGYLPSFMKFCSVVSEELCRQAASVVRDGPLTWPHQGAVLQNNVPFQISNGPQLSLVKLRASLCFDIYHSVKGVNNLSKIRSSVILWTKHGRTFWKILCVPVKNQSGNAKQAIF
jgi:hypothetical protein